MDYQVRAKELQARVGRCCGGGLLQGEALRMDASRSCLAALGDTGGRAGIAGVATHHLCLWQRTSLCPSVVSYKIPKPRRDGTSPPQQGSQGAAADVNAAGPVFSQTVTRWMSGQPCL